MLSLVFSPDGVSTAQLMTELATDIARAGWSVDVITTRPHYNRDPVAEAAQPLTTVWPGLLWKSEIGGVRVYHTRVSAKRGGLASRAREGVSRTGSRSAHAPRRRDGTTPSHRQ